VTRPVFGELVWERLPNGGVTHAFDTGEESETSLCGRAGQGLRTADGATELARCRRCVITLAGPFAVTEAELSDEARAILAYARKWGQPFTRMEIVSVAPGAAWDPYSRWPSTVASLDPLRELSRAGLIAEHDEQPTKPDNHGVIKKYKRWILTGVVSSLADLLDAYAAKILAAGSNELAENDRDRIREEILHRFGRG
jgi:hypothetical protein